MGRLRASVPHLLVASALIELRCCMWRAALEAWRGLRVVVVRDRRLLAARRRVRFDDARGQGLRAARRRLRRSGSCGSPQFKARVVRNSPLLKTCRCPNESIRFFRKS